MEDNINMLIETTESLTRKEFLKKRAQEKDERIRQRNQIDEANAFNTKLKLYITKKQIFEAKITGTSVITLNGNRTAAANAIVRIDTEDVTVEIPFDEMYTSQVLDMTTVNLTTETGKRDYISRMEKMLIKVRGTTCSVCITELYEDPDNPQFTNIICSRRLACELIRKREFLDKKCCKLGDIRTAKIFSVSDHALVASYNGADFTIQQYNLTFRYLSNLKSYYKAGDSISFIVKDLKIEGSNVVIEPELKSVELMQTAERLTRSTILRPGSKIGAHITTVAKKQNIPAILNCWSEDYQLPVFAEITKRAAIETEPKSGDEVILTINTVNRETGVITAFYYRHANEQGLFDTFFVRS